MLPPSNTCADRFTSLVRISTSDRRLHAHHHEHLVNVRYRTPLVHNADHHAILSPPLLLCWRRQGDPCPWLILFYVVTLQRVLNTLWCSRGRGSELHAGCCAPDRLRPSQAAADRPILCPPVFILRGALMSVGVQGTQKTDAELQDRQELSVRVE